MAELQQRYQGLTAREQKVMDLVVSGMQTKQIASVLGTSEITAAVHRGRVMHKMQAGSPAELGSMAERLKFTPSRWVLGHRIILWAGNSPTLIFSIRTYNRPI